MSERGNDTDDNQENNTRSERLRQTRKRVRSRAERTSESNEPGESSEPSDSSKPSKPSESTEPSELDEGTQPSETGEPVESGNERTSVKEEQVGTYMYLPKSQKREMERIFNLLKAEYEYEFDTNLEKNRHLYPLVVKYGLDSLEGLDAQEIQDRLDSIDGL